ATGSATEVGRSSTCPRRWLWRCPERSHGWPDSGSNTSFTGRCGPSTTSTTPRTCRPSPTAWSGRLSGPAGRPLWPSTASGGLEPIQLFALEVGVHVVAGYAHHARDRQAPGDLEQATVDNQRRQPAAGLALDHGHPSQALGARPDA